MKIEHIALWVKDLEAMKEFYCTYFKAISNDKYVNERTGFSSYFLSFGDGKTRIELMNRADISQTAEKNRTFGFAHFAFSVGSKEAVDTLTERLRTAGYVIAGEPRTTGDGCYESVVLDPEGNLVEITV
ncbi:MAG: VOC family protein [Tannerella sp.]|jgi:lactoylglutathione lyase|nr:VOC family protein [Tannerella sp.]